MRGSVSETSERIRGSLTVGSKGRAIRNGPSTKVGRRRRPSFPDRGPLISPAHNNGTTSAIRKRALSARILHATLLLAQHPAYIRHELLRKDVRNGAGLDVSTFDLNVERNTRP